MTHIGHRIFFFLLPNGFPACLQSFLYSFLGDNKHILIGRLIFYQNRTEIELRLH